jgi:mono/diheme cytochrome c family protein
MNKYNWVTLAALIIYISAWPVYATFEPARMSAAQQVFRQRSLVEGTEIYLESCAQCHGAAGEGLGVMPSLNNPALADANTDFLFKTIARAAHGTTMAAWHVDEGGILSDYQIEELVTLIQFVDWREVEQSAKKKGFSKPLAPAYETGLTYLEGEGQRDPHTCFACHEEPKVHLGQFGLNCARCHNTLAWTPAQLTKHIFLLDHGGKGKVACETCHVQNYYEHDCYGCHDHQPQEMQIVHTQENLLSYENCIECHPTGRPGEGRQWVDSQVSQQPNLSAYRSMLLESQRNK